MDLKVFQMIMRYVINDEWYENKTRGNLWDLNQKQSQRECGVRDQDVKLHFWSLDIEKCLVFLSYIITIVKDISCKPGEFCFEQRIVVGAKRLNRKAQSLYWYILHYTTLYSVYTLGYVFAFQWYIVMFLVKQEEQWSYRPIPRPQDHERF